MQHEQFQDLLDALVRRSGIGQEVLGEVLARTSLRAPMETSRVEIAAGNPTARRPVDQRAIAQGTVSKAVKALLDVGLLEDGEKLLRNPDGRPLAPIRLGSLYATAGVKVALTAERPTHVTTALLGLDSSRVLGTIHDPADCWDQVVDLACRHVVALKDAADKERFGHGLEPLRLFGVGVEVGGPVYNGEVKPQASSRAKDSIPVAENLRGLLEASSGFGHSVPVIVENDVNALAVLAIHEIHYTDPDLVVVGVYDEGVGGGLVMDGRLRRGSNGRAMEVGHLEVGFPPGQEPPGAEFSAPAAAGRAGPTAGFSGPCACGHFGHVDTLAPAGRIEQELNLGSLDEISSIERPSKDFERANQAFARGGAALGRALGHVSNTVNPTRVIVYLPSVLAEPKPESAGAAYLNAVEAEVSLAFAAEPQPRYLAVRSFPANPADIALVGARAVAVCVLESFIEHALRLDDCQPVPRRTAVGAIAG